MNENTQKELVRVIELDYEKTTKEIKGIVSSSFTIRSWGIALISALIGFTLQTNHLGNCDTCRGGDVTHRFRGRLSLLVVRKSAAAREPNRNRHAILLRVSGPR
jgi:hypothetical protein